MNSCQESVEESETPIYMHEFSVAQNIVEIVTESFVNSGAKKIISVEIDVGILSGVVIDALQFAMDAAKNESPLEKANIIFNDIPAKATCRDCKKEFELIDFLSNCTYCNSINSDIIKGKELKVKSIEVE